jgi:hypothetical protein
MSRFILLLSVLATTSAKYNMMCPLKTLSRLDITRIIVNDINKWTISMYCSVLCEGYNPSIYMNGIIFDGDELRAQYGDGSTEIVYYPYSFGDGIGVTSYGTELTTSPVCYEEIADKPQYTFNWNGKPWLSAFDLKTDEPKTPRVVSVPITLVPDIVLPNTSAPATLSPDILVPDTPTPQVPNIITLAPKNKQTPEPEPYTVSMTVIILVIIFALLMIVISIVVFHISRKTSDKEKEFLDILV